VIQDYLGGELMRGEVDGSSHYWNVIQGKTIDLTRDQFARFAPTGVRPRKRDHLFAYLDTAQRYDILCNSVRRILTQSIRNGAANGPVQA